MILLPADRRYRLLLKLAILALTALVLWPALSGPLIFDDFPIFVSNPAVHVHGWQLAEWQRLLQWTVANVQRPLSMLSLGANFAAGAGTWGFKATNLAIHLLNVLLVLALAGRLLPAAWCKHRPAEPYQFALPAAAVTAAWAIHPLQISTVMYVVQRMEMLGFTFVLLALLAYWHARRRQQDGKSGWPWLLLCGALAAIGYLAKETAVLVPGYALVLELTVLRFDAARPAIGRAWRRTYALGCLLALGVFFFYVLPHYATPAAYSGRAFDAWERELTQLRVLPMYLRWSVFPLPSQMHFYYDNYRASTGLLTPATTLWGGLFLAALLALAVAVRRRRPLLALGIGWFFVAHALTSSPIGLELVFEHRNYPALLGVILAVADLLQAASRRLNPRLVGALAAILLLNLAFFATLRASTWGNPLQLEMTLASDNPGSVRAGLDLARRFMSMADQKPDSPLFWQAVTTLEHAARQPGGSPLPEEALLLVAADHPQQVSAGPWWKSLRRKLRTQPLGSEYFVALNKLTGERIGGKTGIDATELAKAYDIALDRRPRRASLHTEYAELASVALHDPSLAITHWQAALALHRDTRDFALQLAGYLLDNHRPNEASAVITKARQLDPALAADPTLVALQQRATESGTNPPG